MVRKWAESSSPTERCACNATAPAAPQDWVDVPYCSDLVGGVEKPIVNKGYITVPDKPGLGITINEATCKQHMAEPGWFEPTDQWNNIGHPNDRLWS